MKNRNLRQVYAPSGDYVRNRKIAVSVFLPLPAPEGKEESR